jgi:hypothetical protein
MPHRVMVDPVKDIAEIIIRINILQDAASNQRGCDTDNLSTDIVLAESSQPRGFHLSTAHRTVLDSLPSYGS